MPDADTATALLALDWGTTSARAYRVGNSGEVLEERSGPFGIQQVAPGTFAQALATLLGDWSEFRLPRLACGMIGSRQGWVEAPYRTCPVALSDLAANMASTSGHELAIVAGITCRDDSGVPDVIRGEETQVVGLLETQAISEAVIVQPGTHSKWTIVRDGAILTFRTYMTGETFAVLRAHSILGRLMAASADIDWAAFERGVRRGLAPSESGELLHRVFGARTLALFGEVPETAVADYLSGLLIGAEIGAGAAWAAHHLPHVSAVWLLGTPELSMRYLRALAVRGIEARTGPSDAAARGLWRLAREAGLVT